MKIFCVLVLSCLACLGQTQVSVQFVFTDNEIAGLTNELNRVNALFIAKRLPPVDLPTMIQGQYRATHLRVFTNTLAGIQATNLLNAFKAASKQDQDAIKEILKIDAAVKEVEKKEKIISYGKNRSLEYHKASSKNKRE